MPFKRYNTMKDALFAGASGLEAIGTARNDYLRTQADVADADTRRVLAQQQVDKNNRTFKQELGNKQLVGALQDAGAMTPEATTGTGPENAVDFQAIKAAKKYDAEAELWNRLNMDKEGFVPVTGQKLKQMDEAKALAANKADQGEILAQESGRLKSKVDTYKAAAAAYEPAQAAANVKATISSIDNGKFSPVTLAGNRLGIMDTRHGTVKDSGEEVQPKNISPQSLQNAQGKLTTLAAMRMQLKDVQDKFDAIKGGISSGKLTGFVPTEKGEQFDKAVAALKQTARQLTRTPGEGSMSDYETKLSQMSLPNRHDYDSVTQQSIDQLNDLANVIGEGYKQMVPATKSTQSGAAGGSDAAPAVGATKQNSHGDTVRWTGNGWEIVQ